MTGKNFLSFPVLKTVRLVLRQLNSSDDNEILGLRSNENINKYLNRKPSQTIDDARNFIQTINNNIQRNESIYWAIALIGSDELIGTICLFNFSNDDSIAEIGYELNQEFQGKGLMHEAISKVIDFGIQSVGLNSIEAYTHSGNLSSIRLLEKLNFKKELTVDENFTVYRLMHNG